MLRIFFFLLALLPIVAPCAEVSIEEAQKNIQPPTKPMEVKTGFYLLNLVSINEKDETFVADVYFVFSWNDPRLGFEGDQEHPHIYSEDAAKKKLETIWWPDPEFINTSLPEVTNRTLYIYPDGKVAYTLGMTANFRGAYDYRKFPFDSQQLEIKMSSFVWDKKWLDFVVDSKEVNYSKAENIDFMERRVTNVAVEVIDEKRGFENDIYSNYLVKIATQRNPSFYLYQILIPCFIVLMISYCALYIDPKDFANRLIVGLTSILVFIATRFAINTELPRINYITLIDKIFFLFYLCAGITVGISLIERVLVEKEVTKVLNIEKKARILLPVLFLVIFLIFFLTQIY